MNDGIVTSCKNHEGYGLNAEDSSNVKCSPCTLNDKNCSECGENYKVCIACKPGYLPDDSGKCSACQTTACA